MKIKLYQQMRRGFTLLEVMIAIGIFFIGSFGILQVVSQSLSNARRLQHPLVDASSLLSQLSLTNALVEGEYSGSLEDMLGKNYAGYTWKGEVTEVRSNKLFSADFYIFDNKDILYK